ncbi:MAG: NAD(P)/FAD-dependent oxidoreductase, partial [Senegalia sp. (in: firmicutes)]
MFTKTIEDARKKGINLLQKHEVKSVDFDEKKVFVEDLENAKEKVFDYNELVIATGASPFIPDIEGINSENVYTLTKPYIAKDLKENIDNYKNIAIVGGGFIGVEVAEQLSRYDHLNISLYHSRDQLLNGVYDTKAGIAAKDEIEKLGVNIHFSERLEDVVAEDKTVKKIITSNRQDEVDAIILAIGVRPNT